MAYAPTSLLPGQPVEKDPQLLGPPQAAEEGEVVSLTIDIPLQDLIGLTAFGNIQLQGTKVSGFSSEATGVLKKLYGNEILKIGNNMKVGSAKDIFFILEEYAKLGEDSNALVRFHCRGALTQYTADEVFAKMERNEKALAPDGRKKARGSILRSASSMDDQSSHRDHGKSAFLKQETSEDPPSQGGRASVKTVDFQTGDSVVAVVAYMTSDMIDAPKCSFLGYLNRNCAALSGVCMFALVGALIYLMNKQGPD